MLPEDDRVRLQHMLDAALKALRIAAGHRREDLDLEDEPLSDALVRLISVIGEAANRVSPATRSELVDIPWSDLVGMRNRLIHGYFDIDLDILWTTVQDVLPGFAQRLELALADDE
jgi:uncharacterized protein with HEPN domain